MARERTAVMADTKEPGPINYHSSTYKMDLIHRLNWYSREKERKDAWIYLKTYVKAVRGPVANSKFRTIPEREITNTMGWLARILIVGGKLHPNDRSRLDTYLDALLENREEYIPPENKEVEKVAKPSVQENLQTKIDEFIGELEGTIDDFFKSKATSALSNILKSQNASRQHGSSISEWAYKRKAEFVDIVNSDNEYVNESYSRYSKRQLNGVIKLLDQYIVDADKYTDYKKANRKPRARKEKTPAQQVAKLKYKKEDTELSIKSVLPTEMVGAEQVWVYNTKYKKLTVYRSDSVRGIQIKGTTLQNYNPDITEQKSLRKPSVTLSAVLSSGKVQLRKIMTDLKTKPSKANGRINEETLIVRVVR